MVAHQSQATSSNTKTNTPHNGPPWLLNQHRMYPTNSKILKKVLKYPSESLPWTKLAKVLQAVWLLSKLPHLVHLVYLKSMMSQMSLWSLTGLWQKMMEVAKSLGISSSWGILIKTGGIRLTGYRQRIWSLLCKIWWRVRSMSSVSWHRTKWDWVSQAAHPRELLPNCLTVSGVTYYEHLLLTQAVIKYYDVDDGFKI